MKTPEEEKERVLLIEKVGDLVLWFSEQGPVIDEKFRPYLQFYKRRMFPK
jgi:hypothetical protein